MRRYKQRNYNEKFKREAVRLANEQGNSYKVAKDLGISDSSIHLWRKQFLMQDNGVVHQEERPVVSEEAEDVWEELDRAYKEIEDLQAVNAQLGKDVLQLLADVELAKRQRDGYKDALVSLLVD